MEEPAAADAEPNTVMIDATFEGSPHGIQPAHKKGGPERLIGRTKGGMNTKLHAVTDANGAHELLHDRWAGQRLLRGQWLCSTIC